MLFFQTQTLHWIKDHRPVIAGIQKGLKPGGRILLQMGGKGNAASIFAIMHEMMSKMNGGNFFLILPFHTGFTAPRNTQCGSTRLDYIQYELN